ncbi:MAG: glycosyl transferase, partial [Anaerolineales bacterium]
MTDTARLFAHFSELDEARRALAGLQRAGFPRSALVYRLGDGSPQVFHPARRNQRIWRVLGGLGLGLLGGAIPTLLDGIAWPLPLPFMNALTGLAGFWLGVLLGWLYSRQATPRVDLSLLEHHGKLLAPDENVLILEARLHRLQRALPILRDKAPTEPSVFALHPERSFQQPEAEIGQVALPISQIQDHAIQLAREQRVGSLGPTGLDLIERLGALRSEIGTICSDLGHAARLDQRVGPTAEWVLDNEYIIEGHVRDVQANLTRRFYRELPALAAGPDRGLPRVYTIARELIYHTDCRLDRENIGAFLEAYQSVQVLKISELWALPLMFRIALVESIHALAVQALDETRERESADYWANRLLAISRRDPAGLFSVLAELSEAKPNPSFYFGSQLAGHLYDEEAALAPVRSWLERARRRQLPEMQQREQRRQAGEQVSMGNAISSLRQLSLLDWRDVFERYSHVEKVLRRDPALVYANMDFDTRNSYREAVETIARGSHKGEVKVAEQAVTMAQEAARRHGTVDRRAHIGTWLTAELRPELSTSLECREPWRFRLREWVYRHHNALYFSSIVSLTLAIIGLAWWLSMRQMALPLQLALFALMAPLASQIAVDFTNYLVTRLLPPRRLPKMDFEEGGIPEAFRTLVTVPVLFNSPQSIREEVEDLEIRYLANPEENLAFSLFVDYPDSPVPESDQDRELLTIARQEMEALNARHGDGTFYLFCRDRTWT